MMWAWRSVLSAYAMLAVALDERCILCKARAGRQVAFVTASSANITPHMPTDTSKQSGSNTPTDSSITCRAPCSIVAAAE